MRQECFPQLFEPEGSSEPERPPGGFPAQGESTSGGEGGFPEGSHEQFQQEFQQQYQQEFQRQFEQQYQQQYQEEYQRQLEQQSSGEFQAPTEFHSEEPAPSSQLPRESFLGAVWEAMKPGLSRFLPTLR